MQCLRCARGSDAQWVGAPVAVSGTAPDDSGLRARLATAGPDAGSPPSRARQLTRDEAAWRGGEGRGVGGG